MTSHETEASVVALKSFAALELKFRNAFFLKDLHMENLVEKRNHLLLLSRPSFYFNLILLTLFQVMNYREN